MFFIMSSSWYNFWWVWPIKISWYPPPPLKGLRSATTEVPWGAWLSLYLLLPVQIAPIIIYLAMPCYIMATVMWHSHRLGTQTHYQGGDWRRLHFQHISFITACFQIVFVSLVCRYHEFSWNRTDVWGITASDAMEASLSFSSLLSLSPLFFCSLQLTFPLLFPFYGWPITIPDQSDPDIAPSLFLGHWP